MMHQQHQQHKIQQLRCSRWTPLKGPLPGGLSFHTGKSTKAAASGHFDLEAAPLLRIADEKWESNCLKIYWYKICIKICIAFMFSSPISIPKALICCMVETGSLDNRAMHVCTHTNCMCSICMYTYVYCLISKNDQRWKCSFPTVPHPAEAPHKAEESLQRTLSATSTDVEQR